MKLKTTLFILTIVSFAVTGISQDSTVSENASAMQAQNLEGETPTLNLTEMQEQYNENSDEIPGFVGTVIGDQTITVNLSQLETGSEMLEEDIIGVKTNGVETEDIQWGKFEQPTLEIWITQNNVESLQSADNPAEKLNEMMKNDEIKYETHTLGNSVMFGVLELFSSLS